MVSTFGDWDSVWIENTPLAGAAFWQAEMSKNESNMSLFFCDDFIKTLKNPKTELW
jgi:uncharacterized membrane protein